MAWRFKPSKYKNAAPVVPKKELWIRDVDAGSPPPGGMPIAASAALMAFVVRNRNGGSVAILPVNETGRQDHGPPLLAAHADCVTDMTFSPFDDGLLATGSADCTVRVWSVPEGGLEPGLEPELSLDAADRRLERVLFHPTADCLLSAAFGTTVRLWDILHQKQLYSWDGHGDQVQSMSWRGDGGCLATTSRDTLLRVLDPRADKVCHEGEAHVGSRDSWVTWLGCTEKLVTTGFDQYRQRQVTLRDLRKPERPLKTLTSDSCTGILVPLYDADTGMLFLAGKGDTSISYMEVTDKEPFFVEGIKHTGEQTKGACLVPKRALDVMNAEVNRILQLTSQAVVPITYQVPRKTYRDFHGDLYPDTPGCDPAMSAAQWWAGADRPPRRVSLDPAKVVITDLQRRRGRLVDRHNEPEPSGEEADNKSLSESTPEVKHVPSKPTPLAKPTNLGPKPYAPPKPAAVSVRPEAGDAPPPPPAERQEEGAGERRSALELRRAYEQRLSSVEEKPVSPPMPKRTSVNKSFRRVSKCRFMKATPVHKSEQFENIKNLNKSTTNECNGIYANPEYTAILLAGPGGKVCVLNMQRPGRQPDGVVPCLLNGAKVMDFSWDPFDNSRIAVGCDDGCVRVWRIPAGGLTEPTNECETTLAVHQERLLTLQYHPLADGVLASAGQDRRVIVWDRERPRLELETHPDQIFSLAWSPCGRYLATLCKDARLRVFEPRAGPEPLRVGDSHRGPRGGRVCWVLGGHYLITTGFDKSSERQISLYRASDLERPVTTLSLDVSPSILMPHYDPDTSTLFLTAKGDTSVLGYEVAEDYPHLFPLTPYKTPSCHQGVAFLPKSVCDVRKVEFARCVRLLPTAAVPISFSVPRVKADLFQDDLFPPTRVTWEATMTAEEWLGGANVPARLLDLQPDDMVPLSKEKGGVDAPKKAQPAGPKATNGQHSTPISSFAPKPDKKKGQELESSLSDKLATNFTLEQDTMEGVAEEEWDE
ncbi:coronin-7-like [Pollicipes pollicipes]|uniref:coronin-7-like n=1 Tax=Pollicipes pollicipes TaxID=41117 RepID=UPI001885465D|nr:coronin-7-like [Pollicipes pollicipes]